MTIQKTLENGTLTIIVQGQLDSNSAKQLEAEIVLDDVNELVIDFNSVSYVSSAGLRVIFHAHKQMTAKEGTLVVRNVKGLNMEIFDSVGFTDFLTIVNDEDGENAEH